MKLTTGIIALFCFTFITVIALIAALIALGKDPAQFITALSGAVIPSVIGLVAVFKSSKAEQNSAQAVHNTNGRIGELVYAIHSAGGTVPPGYEDVTPTPPKTAAAGDAA